MDDEEYKVNFVILDEDYQPDKKKISKKLPTVSIMLLAILVGGLGFGIGLGFTLPIAMYSRISSDTFVELSGSNLENVNYPTSQPLNVVGAIELAKPSVVSISTETNVPAGRNSIPFFDQFNLSASGTGVVFDKNEQRVFILTNEHVISNAHTVSVRFGNSENIRAFIVSTERQSDLAVLYVLRSDLEEKGINNVVVATFGDSSEMQIGETVMAIGNALGQGISTTMGIVSARNIQISIDDRLLTVLQTDAAINPGNSGGPLINMNGEVIGINTVKFSQEDVSGMGYSITSNAALPILENLRGELGRPFLGVSGITLSTSLAYSLGINDTRGVYVTGLHPESSAYSAGLQQGDIITHFNNVAVTTMTELIAEIAKISVGYEIEVRIIRDRVASTKRLIMKGF